ncbi:MAG: GAF domain-containing protein [Anaerolineales bacterium]|nr:GAF domain-containing protein [Anaerolineales bacterium]
MNQPKLKLPSISRWLLAIPLSLRGKLIVGNMLITLLAILGMGYYVYFRAQESNDYLTTQLEQSVSQSADEQLAAVANEQSATLNDFFSSKSYEISLIGANLNNLLSGESRLGNGVYWDSAQSLSLLPNGSWDNSNEEPSSIFIPAGPQELTPAMVAVLNTIKLTESSVPPLLEKNPEIIAIYFGGTFRETIYYPNIDLANIVPPDFDVTQRPWYVASTPRNNPEGSVVWSEPYQDAALNGLVVTASIPVFDSYRRFRGVAAMDIQLNQITSIVSNIRLGDTGYAFLVDRDNRLIAFPQAGYDDFGISPESLPLGEIVTQQELPSLPTSFFETLSKISAGESGFTKIKINDTTRYIIYRPLPEVGYGLAILVPEVELQKDAIIANEQINRQTRNAILVSLFLILGILFTASLASLVMGNAVTAPLISLTKTARAIAGGDLDARAEIHNQDEIGILGQSLNMMAAELQKSFGSLEQGVADRTRELEIARTNSERRASDLQAISEISKVIAGEQKLDTLLPLITRVVSDRFGFYHIGIFLIDEANQYAVLLASNSEGGQAMLHRGHMLEVGGGGIVGYVAKFSAPRIALDVGLDAVFFNNPDLPETRSEMAVPLIVRNKIVGVLDLQSTKAGAFTDNEVNTMSILADQIAIAIENARLFQQTQQALIEAETLYRQNIKEGWSKFSREETSIGYYQTLKGGGKLNAPIDSEEIRQAMNSGEAQIFNNPQGAQEPSIVVPIKLRGQVIGALNVKSPASGRHWSADEVNLVEAISERLSFSLENARLIQESQRQVIKEQTISEVTGKIGASINLKNVLQTAVEELARAMPGSEVIIEFDQKNGNPD